MTMMAATQFWVVTLFCASCFTVGYSLTDFPTLDQILYSKTPVDFPALDHLYSKTPVDDQQQAAQDLFTRVLKDKASHFKAQVVGKGFTSSRDTFNIVSNGDLVTVSGTSGVAVAMGFYYYLKMYCGCQFTWAGEQLHLPSPLPVIQNPGKTVTVNDRFRYYENVCTVSYSFVFWNWTRWERHIDWMAMNGINLPLAFTGQEAIFQRVYRSMGFTLEDLQNHFGGPAFLAWARMGNMHGWGGPLPQSWIDEQLVLQHKILNRMRSLGIIPVLPGFAGHVPSAIIRLYPNASVSHLGDWGHFNATYCCTYLLDFMDPLFKEIGSRFITEMKLEFGVDHIYNADSFNEMTPKTNDTVYLRNAGQAVYNAMIAADPQAVWLMQGWLFQEPFWQPPQIKSLVTSVPQGRMIILDLFTEERPIYPSTNSFYGQPFIWCMLHNFGGTMELYGDIMSINTGPFIGRTATNSTMIGIGMTPEGIFQNEVIYEFMAENTWAEAPRNLSQWFYNYPRQRYGNSDVNVGQAWQLLMRSIYNSTDGLRDHSKGVIPTSRPALKHKLKPDVWYNPTDLYTAWELLVNSSYKFQDSVLYRYDLVDVTRNSLQLISLKFYTDVIEAYKDKNITGVQHSGQNLVDLLSDMEVILASDSHFLLGTWIRDARSKGITSEESDLMEFNARNQVTLWGPTGEIRDYAAKQWSGLMRDYYLQRWGFFITLLEYSISEGKPFDEESFKQQVLVKFEQPFSTSKLTYPTEQVGDSIALANSIFHRYKQYTSMSFYTDYWSQCHTQMSKEKFKQNYYL